MSRLFPSTIIRSPASLLTRAVSRRMCTLATPMAFKIRDSPTWLLSAFQLSLCSFFSVVFNGRFQLLLFVVDRLLIVASLFIRCLRLHSPKTYFTWRRRPISTECKWMTKKWNGINALFSEFFWKTESFSQSCLPTMFHLSFIIVTLSIIVSSLPSRALRMCVCAYAIECAPLAYVCLCYNCTIVLFKWKKRKEKRKKAGYVQPKQAKYFLNYSHNMYFFFSISNGYLFALCLNERNKYKKIYIERDRLVYTYIHSNANIYIDTQRAQISQPND